MIQVIETAQGYCVSSKEVAKRFEKRHSNVLRACYDVKENINEFYKLNFEPNNISTLDGQKTDEILMTKNGFAILAMGFTGAEAAKWKVKFLFAFDELESAALQIPELKKKILNLESVIANAKPKQLGASRKGEMMVPVRESSLFSTEGQITYKRMSTEGIPELTKVKAQLTHTQRTMEGLARKINAMQARLDLGH